MSRKYYVYVLFREDGFTPFYVGMGQGSRWLKHEHEARSKRPGGNAHKLNIIRQMQAKGLRVPKIKIAEGLSDLEASALEIETIAKIRRIKDGGTLVNATCGGEAGQRALGRTPEESEAVSSARPKTGGITNPERICPECSAPFTAAHPRQRFCTPAHKLRFNRVLQYRGQASTPFVLAWRKGKRGATAESRFALAQLSNLADLWAAEDRDAGRDTSIIVRGRMDGGWVAADYFGNQ